jgi:hypothetical protein
MRNSLDHPFYAVIERQLLLLPDSTKANSLERSESIWSASDVTSYLLNNYLAHTTPLLK